MHFASETLRKVPGIAHGFGTRSEPVPNPFLKPWVEFKPEWNQVHGIEIAQVIRKNQVCGDVDGLFTKTTNPIGVRHADCVPILLARKDGGMVAALHSGWRGTLAKFPEALAKTLNAQGENLSQWVAAIGPAIGDCCYEVSEDLVNDFIKAFPHIEPDLISPKARRLDLSTVNAYELKRLGFGEIDVIDECTYCSMNMENMGRGHHFHSYRREGAGTRQWSMIMRTPTKTT